jgi:hypothetical protein
LTSDVTVPMIEEQGQLITGVGVSSDVACEAAYGLTDKWAVMGSAHVGSRNIYAYNFGIGYYRPSRIMGFEVFAGFGQAWFNYTNPSAEFSSFFSTSLLLLNSDNQYTRFFIQPTLRLVDSSDDDLQVGLTGRITSLHSNHWTVTSKNEQDIETTTTVNRVADIGFGLFLTLRYYPKQTANFHVLLQIGGQSILANSSSNNNKYLWTSPSIIRIGISGTFWKQPSDY